MYYNEYINYVYEAPFLQDFLTLEGEEKTNVFFSANPIIQTLYYSDLVERLSLDDYSKSTVSVIQSQLNLLNLQSFLPMSDDYCVGFGPHLIETFKKLCNKKYPDGLTVPLLHGTYNSVDVQHLTNSANEQYSASQLFTHLAEYFSNSVGLLTANSPDRAVLAFTVRTALCYAYYNYSCYSRLIELLEAYLGIDSDSSDLSNETLSLFLGVFVSERYQDTYLFNSEEYIADLMNDISTQVPLNQTCSVEVLQSLNVESSCDKFVAYHLLKLISDNVPSCEQHKYISALNVFTGISDGELMNMIGKRPTGYKEIIYRASFIYN
ncbi:hypothetical protein ACNO5E_24485 [Vibrio parahaemolyticus]|uniref:hypothetical protein n=1 Tax=Vibrio parahaemolyticus TaxID=670 RepID=UPI000812D11D|nr:hypothetical protein [Vibrio parahaemolyticus]OCP68409.1 hypothetical protein AKH08_16490 [Vibrio parahaemolyticus]